MTVLRFILLFVLLCLNALLFAQPKSIEPYKIEICNNKTTHIIFPFPIKSVDRGSLDVLAQKAPLAESVLQLKADHSRIAPTNVTVITTDNKLYSFFVVYDSMPERLTLSFDSALATSNWSVGLNTNSLLLIDGEQPDAGTLQATSVVVAGEKRQRLRLHDSHELMVIKLTGIYIRNDVYYFALKASNESNVSFSVENISFTVQDTKRFRRKASQEKVIQPLYEYGIEEPVRAQQKSIWVIAVPKFTLEDSKHLHIQILEHDGGRNLSLVIRNKHLLAAKIL